MEQKESENSEDFCKELREKTQTVHDKSDKLINLKLAVVLTDTKLYGTVLADFYHVFQTIEQSVERLGHHDHISHLQLKGLERTEAFEEDLRFYLGDDWRAQYELSEPAKEYCDRILKVSEEDPTLLIAYIHSMFLALLAGGQIIRRIVKKTLGLSGTEGLAIFDFADSGETQLQLKKKLMTSINELKLGREEKDKILVEKRRVFAMNNAIASNVKPTVGSFSRLLKLILIIIIILIIIGNVVMMIFI